MTVSNEDRDPLVHTLPIEDYMAKAVGLAWTPGYYPQLAKAAENWLIAHGWGPTKAAVIEELQLWLESGRVREQGLVGAWEFEVRIAYLRGEDHPMMPRRKGVTDDRTE